jgi:DNA gyrase/topoisomerase IV subunit B
MLSVGLEEGIGFGDAERVFSDLMGEEVAPRKKFIQSHARTVTELDV